MALWDSFDSTDSVKCPGCGSNLIFDASLNKMVCHFCGSIYEPEKLSFESKIKIHSNNEEVSDSNESKLEYACNNCGAVLITDKNTAATFCSYCGSSTLISRRLKNEFKPDVIIPFKITKDDAIKRVNEWIKSNKYKPSNLLKSINLNKITGLYVPTWLVDADCYNTVYASAWKERPDKIEKYYVDRQIEFRVSKVPFDGSKHIDNILMKSLEPFDYNDMVEYSDLYLSGFYAERFDESFFDITERINIRVNGYADQFARSLILEKYDQVEIERFKVGSSNYSQLYAMLPVWFFRFEYDGEYYTFGVNGQTGEVSGSLPYSKIKSSGPLVKLLLKWSVPLLVCSSIVIASIVGMIVLKEFGEQVLLLLILLGVGVTLFELIRRLIWNIKNIQFTGTNPMDPAPKVEEYLDTSKGFIVDGRDEIVSIMRRDN